MSALKRIKNRMENGVAVYYPQLLPFPSSPQVKPVEKRKVLRQCVYEARNDVCVIKIGRAGPDSKERAGKLVSRILNEAQGASGI